MAVIKPITAVFGAEIEFFDFDRPFDAETMAWLRSALSVHGVLVFRQSPDLPREHLIRLAAVFGTIERSPRGDPVTPEIARIVHDANAPPTENIWHVDHSFRQSPPMGTVLRAVETPSAGGDTLFADLRAVWQRLPDSVRELLSGLDAVHDIAKWAPLDRADELHALAPPVTHAAVLRHHESERDILYVNAGYTTEFVGTDQAEGKILLDYLSRMVTVPEVQLRVRWEPGTIAVWDNTSMQHYAVGDYFPARRVMERISFNDPICQATDTSPINRPAPPRLGLGV